MMSSLIRSASSSSTTSSTSLNLLRRSFSSASADRTAFAKRHTCPGVSRLTDLELVSGQGSYVTASNGKSYLDFTTGIGVASTGHCHPKVVKAAQDQTAKIIHAQCSIGWHKPGLDLIERMLTFTPKGLDSFFFWNSGAEAIEAALKVARYATKKPNVIVVQGGYHGRTVGTMALTTSKHIYKTGFGPLMPGVAVASFPYCHHCPSRPANGCCNDPIRSLELVFKQQSAPSDTAAVLLEPVLGEGGYVVPPPGYLQAVREICSKNNVLLIADEVQSGFGRTGKWFAVDHWGVTPDILVFAKTIASGFPLSGIVTKEDLMKGMAPGSMGGTYAGNAVSCAAACATIDVIKEENLLENINKRGQQIQTRLKKLQSQYPDLIADVRGLGLMIGVELNGEKYKSGVASALGQECYKRGLLILTTGVYETMRFIPPFTVSSDEVEKALEIFEQSAKVVSESHRK